MSNKKVINNLLLSVNKLIKGLTNEELEALETGKFKLLLEISKTKSSKSSSISLDEISIKSLIEQLDLAKSREEGFKIVKLALKNKKELEVFAKYIDVAVMISDKVDKIRSNIVDATVGAKLRSNAIQGKEI